MTILVRARRFTSDELDRSSSATPNISYSDVIECNVSDSMEIAARHRSLGYSTRRHCFLLIDDIARDRFDRTFEHDDELHPSEC